ncbi:guanylate kinase [Cutibacterium acnes JCM 18916]|nr:guanylate kinase [Cutibacterium acnes JCM 18916]
MTTRPPRPTERDGIDYDFITPEQFDKLVDGEGLLEWATVHNSHRYGTPRVLLNGQLLTIARSCWKSICRELAKFAKPILRRPRSSSRHPHGRS